MAQRVVRNVEEDYLMCSICLSRYNEPKLLPCGHTFCKQCLTDHITQTVSNSDALTFNCPNDRTEVSRPADVHPREWAERFPTDSFLDNLLLAVRVHEGSAPREALNRQMPPNSSRQMPPNSSRHVPPNSSRQSSNHQEQPIATSRRRQPRVQHGGASGRQSHAPVCAEHPDREQGFFCLGCNVLVCPSCAVRNHRKRTCECLEVDEAVERLQPRIQALRRKFETQIHKVYHVSENAVPDGGALQASKARAHQQLDDLEGKAGRFYALILQHIEDMRQQVNEVSPQPINDDHQLDMMLDSIEQTRVRFDNTVNNSTPIAILKELPKMEKQSAEYDSVMQATERNLGNFKVDFVAHTAFSNFLRNPPPIGNIKVSGGSYQNSGIQSSGMFNFIPVNDTRPAWMEDVTYSNITNSARRPRRQNFPR